MSHTEVISRTHLGRHVPMEKARLPILKRIMDKVEQIESGCWIWKGWRSALGYGHITVQGRGWAVHRLTYTLFKGEISEGMQACHACDTPACCNPDHIFLGTASDNAQDSKKKGRHYTSAKTHCSRGHAYAEHGFIRADGRRECKICERDRWHRERTLGKGPTNRVKTHCKHGHPLSGDNLYIVPRTGHRQCRICRHAVIVKLGQKRASANGSTSHD